MRERYRRARAIADLQSRLCDLTEWRLSASEGLRVALENDRREMLESLNRMEEDGAPAPLLMTHSLRAAERRLASAEASCRTLMEKSRLEKAKSRAAERRADQIENIDRRKFEENTLSSLIEASAGRRKPSQA